MLLGLADDRFSLNWKIRLAVQVLVAGACALRADWRLTGFIDSQFVTLPLTVLWIVALINSFNMLDNMDALSGGVAAIASGMLAVVLLTMPDPATQEPQLFVAGFLLCLVGSVMGFLYHNRPPAKIFMGDAGSYFLGFAIAIATLQATFTNYDSAKPHTIFAPLCVLAVPLYDMISVLLIRIREGRSPFEADRRHFSHRLVDLGMSRPQAVATIYLTTLTCSLGAVLLHQVNVLGAAVVVLLVVCVLVLIAILEIAAGSRRGD
jgi:UDP-GlcNAc:undecaprenyl-phosphate GlcNAc-1-phosphate transferase